MLEILGVIVIGLVVGLIARFVMPGKDPGGLIVTIAVGIAGAVLATYGGQAIGLYAPGQPAGFLGSVVGAVVLLALPRAVRRG